MPKKLADLATENWVALYRELPLQGMLKSIASHMVLAENRLGTLDFVLVEAGQTLYKPDHAERLADLLTSRYQEPVQVQIELGMAQSETPAEIIKREHREAIANAETNMLNSPMIKDFEKEFQAKLVPDSVNLVE